MSPYKPCAKNHAYGGLSSPATAAEKVADTAAVANDENACPNQQSNARKANAIGSRRSSRSLGPKVAELAARYGDACRSPNVGGTGLSRPRRSQRLAKQANSQRNAPAARRSLSNSSNNNKGKSSSNNCSISRLNINDKNKNYNSSNHTSNNNSTESNLAPTPSENDTKIKHEKEQRRRLLLRERRSREWLERRLLEPPASPTDGGNIKFVANVIPCATSPTCDGGHDRNIHMVEASKANGSALEEEALVATALFGTTKDANAQDLVFSDATSAKLPASNFGVTTKLETSTTPSDGSIGKPPASPSSSSKSRWARPRFLAVASQSVLFILILLELQHHYLFSPTATAFGVVTAFSICAVVVSSAMARRRKPHSTKTEESCGGNSLCLQTLLLFLLAVSCWTASLPIFNDCRTERNTTTHAQFRFFLECTSVLQEDTLAIFMPRYSLFDLLAKEWYKWTATVVKSTIKGRLYREIQRGLWRPLAFHGRLKRLFLFLRWAKFIGPLLGTCNKFRGHILDMIKKRRQRIASKKAQKRWSDLLDALSKRSKTERAVLELQKRFRERRESKAKRRFALMSPERSTSNGRVARRIRRRLAEEQVSSRSKLERMEILESQRKLRRQVSEVERKGIARHKESERRMKKRLLLSPRTSFAVGWKYLTVACVALEISQIAFAPILSGELKKMPLDKFLLSLMNASPSSHCEAAPPSIFIPVKNGLGTMCKASSSNWHVGTLFVSTVMVPIVNAVFFLDVFITFFTGELTSSGMLIPKPFFQRYILPGIGLQLIVNPTMVEISRLVKQTTAHALLIGPSLCFHLLFACIPLLAYCYDFLLDMVFDFVEKQNGSCKVRL